MRRLVLALFCLIALEIFVCGNERAEAYDVLLDIFGDDICISSVWWCFGVDGSVALCIFRTCMSETDTSVSMSFSVDCFLV